MAKIEEKRKLNNFRELIDYAEETYGDNICYKYKKDIKEKPATIVETTFKTVATKVRGLATFILNYEKEMKRIVVIGDNSEKWVEGYLGVATSGKIVAPMDKLLPEKEIESLLKRSDIDVAITDKNHLEIFKRLRDKKDNKLETIICMEKVDDKDVIDLETAIEEGLELLKNGDKKYSKVKIKDDEMNIMLFTSGTTDKSKIVMLTQAGIMANVYSIQFHVEITPKDTLLSFLPIHHTFENTITILLSMYKGGTVAFCDGLRHIADNLKEYKITIFVAVPLVMETMYKKIQKGLAEKGKDKLISKMIKISNALLKLHIDLRKVIFKPIHEVFGGHLKKVLYGSASISKDTIIAYNNWGINLIQGYGLTETSPVLTAESETKHRTGSAGYCLINQELKINNPDQDGIGEIVAKGQNVMLGYYNDEEKTKEAFTKDGFFKTGDYGYIDKDGFLFITGRKKDIIVLKNGKNVYPQELEFLITKLDYALECIVFSRDKDKTDTVLKAKIVYDKDRIKQIYGDKSKEEYQKDIWKDIKEINKNLVTYKHIKEIEITDIPMEKTTTQKIKRYVEIEKENKTK